MELKKNPRQTVGLTTDPLLRKEAHGNPIRWQTVRKFSTEQEARDWERGMVDQGYAHDDKDTGWEYGYIFKTPRKK